MSTFDDGERAMSGDAVVTASFGPVVVRPLSASVGGEVIGIDLSRPLGQAAIDGLKAAWDRYALLLIRDQQLEPDVQIAFSRHFGPLQEVAQKQYQMQGRPEIFIIGNAEEGGKRVADSSVGRLWHSDQSFIPYPALGSALYGVECPPEGADTLFGNSYTAYETLPETTKARLEGLHGVHSFAFYYEGLRQRDPSQPELTEARRKAYPDVLHPAVRRHPRTGRKALFVNPAYMTGFAELPGEEGTELMEELFAHQIRPEFTHAHKWRAGDLVMWQNVGLIHVATSFDMERYTRRMHRTTIGSTPEEYRLSLLTGETRLAS
jgi:taurine dioxygenase